MEKNFAQDSSSKQDDCYLDAMLVAPHQYVVARTQNLEKTIQLVKKQYDKNKIIKTELQVLTAHPLATFNRTFESAAKKLKINEKKESNLLLLSLGSGSARKTWKWKCSENI